MFLLGSSLLTIYKSFIRPYLDYGQVIYDRLSNATFSRKIESVQYNTAIESIEVIKGWKTLRGTRTGMRHRHGLKQVGIKLLTKLWLGFNHLPEHKFIKPETTMYFFCAALSTT